MCFAVICYASPKAAAPTKHCEEKHARAEHNGNTTWDDLLHYKQGTVLGCDAWSKASNLGAKSDDSRTLREAYVLRTRRAQRCSRAAKPKPERGLSEQVALVAHLTWVVIAPHPSVAQSIASSLLFRGTGRGVQNCHRQLSTGEDPDPGDVTASHSDFVREL